MSRAIERVWDANEDYFRIQNIREAGEPPDIGLLNQFASSLDAFVEVQSELLPRIGQVAEEGVALRALFDSLSLSPRGENEETICLRALKMIEDHSAAEAEQAAQVGQIDPIGDDELSPGGDDRFAAETKYPNRTEREYRALDDKELVKLAQAGSRLAPKVLVTRHGGLIMTLARKYAPHGRYSSIGADDLFQEGAMALLRSIKSTDLSETFEQSKFISYAAEYVKYQISRYVMNHKSTVHVPFRQVIQVQEVNNMNDNRRNQRLPLLRADEIDEYFGFDPSIGNPQKPNINARLMRRTDLLTRHMGSIDTGYSPHSDTDPGNAYVLDETSKLESLTGRADFEGVDASTVAAGLKATLELALERELSERQAKILRSRFGLDNQDPMTFDQIAANFGVTRQRIRQIEASAQLRLRGRGCRTGLRDFINLG
jgi:RNA polymerase sigma factor (sigma-70 family)